MAKQMKLSISFETLDLIKLVKDRPCLWNKNHEDYKEKKFKDEAWNDIYNILLPDFETFDDQEKIIAAKTISDRWKNIRDSFATSLRRSHGSKKTKKYMHYEELKFLIDVLKAGKPNKNNPNKIFIKKEKEHLMVREKLEPEYFTTESQQSMVKDEYMAEGTTSEAAQQISCQSMMDMDEDMAFFVSLLPTLRKFDDDDKLEFRMGVLSTLKNIKDKKIFVS